MIRVSAKNKTYRRPVCSAADRDAEIASLPGVELIWPPGARTHRDRACQHGGQDNGGLPVTYDDFERYGIRRDCIAPAIRELVALKFMEITKPGRAGNAEFRAPNLFRLTYRHTKREEPSHDWRRIATTEQATKLARQARRIVTKHHRTPVAVSGLSSGGNRHQEP